MKKQDIPTLIESLKKSYPDATCSLDFTTPFELVVAVMLSAQCTDERVNKTTPSLFLRCQTIKDFATIDLSELEDLIHPCGFYKNPHTMEELTSLAGVGRKSANVILLEVFGIAEGIAVDTHAKRISNLLGLSKEKEPVKIEQDLLRLFPKEYLKDVNHLFVWHGRNTCIARNPKCSTCVVRNLCNYYLNLKSY